MGRLIGHCVQWLVMTFNTWPVWDRCSRIGDATCIQPGVYALIAAGSTMCGVTRLSVTLAGKHIILLSQLPAVTIWNTPNVSSGAP